VIRLGPLLQGVLLLLVVAPLVVFWSWMLDDMVQNPLLTRNARTMWLTIFFCFNVFGAGVYYLSLYRGPHDRGRRR